MLKNKKDYEFAIYLLDKYTFHLNKMKKVYERTRSFYLYCGIYNYNYIVETIKKEIKEYETKKTDDSVRKTKRKK